MTELSINALQTLAIGGILVSVIVCVLHVTNVADITFDRALREMCIVFFFTTVGFQADVRLLKTGGMKLVITTLLIALLVICQNGLAVGLAKMFGLPASLGMCTGSISMTGGHGTSAAFGSLLEDVDAGLQGAATISMAAATFGLIAGSVIGGPVANHIIIKKNLMGTAKAEGEGKPASSLVKVKRNTVDSYAVAAFQIALAAGAETLLSDLISKTGITVPSYLGAIVVAALIRNIGECTGKIDINMDHIEDIGNIMLPLFLGTAMISLKLWELLDLAIPLLVLLTAQTVFMLLFARFIVFNALGKDYDAAVMSAGFCGFGLGATPNAMANMKAVCAKYGYSFRAFMIVPIVGCFFADMINSIVITAFINLIR